jgi:micrococcal nuclease
MKLDRLALFLLILGLLAMFSIWEPDLTGKTVDEINYEREPALVTKVVDGDTIETDIGTIRLLGINTPEKGKPYYHDAKYFILELENQTVEILRDKEDKDKYNRFLRYVYYKDFFVNQAILEQGLATAYMTEDLKYEQVFLEAEFSAKQQENGIWKTSKHPCAQCIKLIELDPIEEFFILENQCNQDCNLEGWYVKDASRKTFSLETIEANNQLKIESENSVWNNAGDDFFMRDQEGLLVLHYSY